MLMYYIAYSGGPTVSFDWKVNFRDSPKGKSILSRYPIFYECFSLFHFFPVHYQRRI